ncbi:MAG: diheme cytochrome c [Magnetococcales bacterium]|nr:diheme cytochrome c [Magnetococcales bacterium]
MNNKRKILGVGLILLCVAGGFTWGVNASDQGKSGEKGRRDVEPVNNAQYRTECGACHFAYQPGLLPARSWEKLLNTLGDHFGESAELSKEVQSALLTYLTTHAADRVDSKRSQKIVVSIRSSETPLRITKVRYFVGKHQEIPQKVWEKNPAIGSLMRCETCHTKADQGSFNEHEIQIPGVGRWEN